MKNILLMIFAGLILFGCVTSKKMKKDEIRNQGRSISEREV